MKWETCTLNDICDKANGHIQTGPFGSQLHQSDYSDTGTPVVMPKDIIDGMISEDEIARVEEQHVLRLSRHKVAAGDILFSRRGDVGRCAYISEKEAGWLCGTGCLRVTVDAEIADSRFVFYCLQQPSSEEWIEKHAIGATMLNLNTGILASVPLLLPDLPTQHRIASILSAYDNLIENNRRQIKLLEEAAQRLYREWFVELRFPGHEDVKIVDGVPEGWSIRELNTFGKIITGKTPSTSNAAYYGGSIPFIKIPDMHNGIFPVCSDICLTEEGAESQASKFIPPDSLMVSCIGTVGLVNISYQRCQTNQQINSIVLDDKKNLCFLYHAIMERKSVLEAIGSNGATMTNVNKDKFGKVKVLYPNVRMADKYNMIVSVWFEKIKVLETQITKLCRMRDLLLPKLMSGEMEV